MKAAIYCRVSTEGQRDKGTSLVTQEERCRAYASQHGYDVSDRIFIESYTGAKLERPEMNHLLEFTSGEKVDVLIVYALDRFSRDDTQQGMLYYTLRQRGITLESVTEGKVEDSPLGRLVMHVYGFKAETERLNILERTSRGLHKRAENGRLPSGRRGRLYGYTYMPGKAAGEGVRYINETEAQVVKDIYKMYCGRLSLAMITKSLNENNTLSPSGGKWNYTGVWAVLRNEAYTGRTFVFTEGQGRKPKPRSEWTEVPGATPRIIEDETFHCVQELLIKNCKHHGRNSKRNYLLSGHIKCGRCGKPFWAFIQSEAKLPYYICSGKIRQPKGSRCENHSIRADKLDNKVWDAIKKRLDNPSVLIDDLEKLRVKKNNAKDNVAEMAVIEKRLKGLDQEQAKLLQWALKGFPEETVIAENQKINANRVDLKAMLESLVSQLKEKEQAEADSAAITRVIDLIQQGDMKTFQAKRKILDDLNIEIVIDGTNIDLHGRVDLGCISSAPLRWN